MATPTSQEVIIQKYLNWDLVEVRLAKYLAIARAFPLKMLKSRSAKPPYFCHYAAWRLGTWTDERLVARFDALLSIAELLPNWPAERKLLQGGDYADFWSLYWQLQVADFLHRKCLSPAWTGAGPDIKVQTPFGPAFIECFVFRKSFGIEAFLEDLVQQTCVTASILRDSALPFAVASEALLTDEISKLLLPFIDECELSRKQALAVHAYPVVLSEGQHARMRIVLNGPNIDAYDSSIGSTSVGDPTEHLRIALGEAVQAKAGKNGLKAHHPNLVLVNLLLSRDAQGALYRSSLRGQELPPLRVPSDIDAIALSVVGIDRALEVHDLLILSETGLQPALQFILNGHQSY